MLGASLLKHVDTKLLAVWLSHSSSEVVASPLPSPRSSVAFAPDFANSSSLDLSSSDSLFKPLALIQSAELTAVEQGAELAAVPTFTTLLASTSSLFSLAFLDPTKLPRADIDGPLSAKDEKMNAQY